MSTLKKMKNWFEARFAAAAFAESNDHTTAREIAGLPEPVETRQRLEDLMAAAAFAEANVHDQAREILGAEEPLEDYLEKKLGVTILYGVAAVEDAANDLGIPGVVMAFGTAEV